MVSTISMEQNLLITMDYDEKGNLTAMTDSLGNETNLSYASNGKLTGITD